MASKICPECDKKHGSRKKECECGHTFIGAANAVYPEPGSWVLDLSKGMPKPQQPEPLPSGRQMTNREVQQHVAYEGLGFAVYSLIPSEKIKDKKLSQLWAKARAEMQKIVEYLE